LAGQLGLRDDQGLLHESMEEEKHTEALLWRVHDLNAWAKSRRARVLIERAILLTQPPDGAKASTRLPYAARRGASFCATSSMWLRRL
jgi:hypothetical protein